MDHQARYRTCAAKKRLNAWGDARHMMLVDEILCTSAQYLTATYREKSEEHRAKTYHSLILIEKLRMAVKWITKQDTGRVLHPAEHCTKTGDRVIEVLHTKYPNKCPTSAAILDTYTG